jgi:hypothetical protein
MPAESEADRAAFLARKGRATDGEDDLVAAVVEGKADVANMPAAALPEPMRAMAPAARAKMVDDKQKERTVVLREIAELSKQREAYVKNEESKSGAKDKKSFDGRVRSGLERQAKDHGLAF